MPHESPPPSARTLRLRQYRINRTVALHDGQELDCTGAVYRLHVVHRDGVIVDVQTTIDFTNEPTPPASPINPGL